MTFIRDVRGGIVGSPIVFLTVAVAVGLIGAAALAGLVAAHEEDADLAAHNQTQVADENGVVTTLTLDKATADEEFYVDVHGPDGDLNETATFEANTTLELALEPGVTDSEEVSVAIHATDGTELLAESVAIDVQETDGTDGEMNGTDGMNGSDGGTTDAGTEDGEESSGSGAGFGVVAALAAIAAALAVARRR